MMSKVHESCLIGKEGQGWMVTNATLEVEHGGGRGGGGQKKITWRRNSSISAKQIQLSPNG